MSPFGVMSANVEIAERVWRALADASRREILDRLAERPLTTGEIVSRFEDSLCRTAVMKHLDVLVQANLVVIRRRGRQRVGEVVAVENRAAAGGSPYHAEAPRRAGAQALRARA